MELSELVSFAKRENARILARYPSVKDPERMALAQTVKLGEEVGELCQQVLAAQALQRDRGKGREAGPQALPRR